MKNSWSSCAVLPTGFRLSMFSISRLLPNAVHLSEE